MSIKSALSRLFTVCVFLFCLSVQAEEARISVEITGVSDNMASTLRNGLTIERHKASERLTQRYVEKLHQNSIEELTNMLTVYGYYHPEITANLSIIEQKQENDAEQASKEWSASYAIEPGEPVVISKLDIQLTGEAETDEAFEKLLADFPLNVEQKLNHQTYEKAKKNILSLAARRGYFDGKLTKSLVEVRPEINSASVYLYYESGPRYLFDEIHFPKTVIGERLLSRLQPFDAGDPYLDAEVLAFRSSLSNSGYFDVASVRAKRDERHDGKVPLDIELVEKPKHSYTAGVGYGTDTGARLALGWENRYVNDRGHRIDVDARLSQVSNSLSADYVMPFWSRTINTVGFNTEFKQQDTDTSESESLAVGSYYKRQRWGWDETGSLKLLNEDFDVSDDSESTLLLIPGISWSRTWADNTLYTRHGGRLSLALSGASESLISDITFGQIVLRGKYIKSLGANGRIITRGGLGATEVSDFEKLPSSLRFFAGGDNSIRGFDYQSLGPEGDDGEVEGGRYLAVGSVEYEHMFLDDWGGAIFTDFGNAYNDFSDPIEYSVGIGVRWRSPVGLIRVDIAKGLSDTDQPIGLHIVIGPDL
ncbi:autotransporter assembly complex protein TamA [Methylophaga sp.]|uniref:autotransporter assembly complex protein TamA n=1 Tax=Methylophaga sp. TaxID=2024840 RepID=UPI003F6A033E